jgi:hypothetical protein
MIELKKVKSEKFHHHQASINYFQLINNPHQVVEVFYSYDTPQVITFTDTSDGMVMAFYNPMKYSSTTTRQVNRFIRERMGELKPENKGKLPNRYHVINDFSLFEAVAKNYGVEGALFSW